MFGIPSYTLVRSNQSCESSGPDGGASDGYGLGRGAVGLDRVRLSRLGRFEPSYRDRMDPVNSCASRLASHPACYNDHSMPPRTQTLTCTSTLPINTPPCWSTLAGRRAAAVAAAAHRPHPPHPPFQPQRQAPPTPSSVPPLPPPSSRPRVRRSRCCWAAGRASGARRPRRPPPAAAQTRPARRDAPGCRFRRRPRRLQRDND